MGRTGLISFQCGNLLLVSHFSDTDLNRQTSKQALALLRESLDLFSERLLLLPTLRKGFLAVQ